MNCYISVEQIRKIVYTIIVRKENETNNPHRRKEKIKTMTKEEMQRFLNREAEKGSTEYEALKALADILGIQFPELKPKA